MELDPTKNNDLHLYIWNQLVKRIETEIALRKKKAETSNDETSTSDDGGDGGEINLPETTLSKTETLENVAAKSEGDCEPKSNSVLVTHGKNMRRLTKLVCSALLNPLVIPWDIEQYYHQHVKAGRDKKRKRFPDPLFGEFSDPLTVVDGKGRIVLWYLPGLLSHEQQSTIKQATVCVEPMLKRSVEKESPDKTPNWRTHDVNFVTKTSRDTIEPGAITFSAGWFGQGHDTVKYPLLASLNLRTQNPTETSNWLKMSNDVEKFLNLTLSLINPDLFQSGLEMLRRLRLSEQTKDIAQRWQSVYTGIAIICNRKTPLHRDRKGRPEWFDTLLNYSESSTSPRLAIDDIGLSLQYSSGAVVGFCGTVLKHEVKSCETGNRICYAHFMREAVRDRLDVTPAGWVYRDKYLPAESQEAVVEEDAVEMD